MRKNVMSTLGRPKSARGVLLIAGLLAGLGALVPAWGQTQSKSGKGKTSPKAEPGSIYGRTGAAREKALKENGGSEETEAAVARGLQWLARQQITQGARIGCFPLEGGRYKDRGANNDTAGTALGLLPFLGSGYTHTKAKKAKENPYDKVILAGLAFLLRKQDRNTGDLRGGMYGHAYATVALCEAYGLSRDPTLKLPAQMALNYLIRAQHQEGGWRYGPGQAGDTSVTGAVLMALKTGQIAGLSVPAGTFKKALQFLDGECDPTTEGYRYIDRGPTTPTMSAVGLLCREYLQGWNAQNPRLAKGVEKNLLTRLPDPTFKNIYYYYYASQVLHHHGGEPWRQWNEKMQKVLLHTQVTEAKDANNAGSWSSAGDPYSGSGGRIMATSLALLILEGYYRHMPLHRRDDK
jgi:hypothetical protein